MSFAEDPNCYFSFFLVTALKYILLRNVFLYHTMKEVAMGIHGYSLGCHQTTLASQEKLAAAADAAADLTSTPKCVAGHPCRISSRICAFRRLL